MPLLSGCLETKLFLHRASWKSHENAGVNKLNQQNDDQKYKWQIRQQTPIRKLAEKKEHHQTT